MAYECNSEMLTKLYQVLNLLPQDCRARALETMYTDRPMQWLPFSKLYNVLSLLPQDCRVRALETMFSDRAVHWAQQPDKPTIEAIKTAVTTEAPDIKTADTVTKPDVTKPATKAKLAELLEELFHDKKITI